MALSDHPALLQRARTHRQTLADQLAVLTHRLGETQTRHTTLTAAQDTDRQTAETLTQAVAVLNQLIEVVSGRNLARLTEITNMALRTVFYDQEVEFKITTEVKRNMTTYRFVVMQDGVEGTTASFGGGVMAVIAFVLKVLFNRFAKRYPFIALDESLSFVSAQYIPRTSALIKEIVHDFGVPVLLITHQPAFAAAADHNFEAVPGNKFVGTKYKPAEAPDV